MLFNSQDFIFVFLPACLLITYLCARLGGLTAGKIALIVMSLAFYAYWRVDHVWIILASIVVNYLGVRLATRLAVQGLRNLGLAALVSFNVILIGAFKYFNLILTSYHDLTGIAVDLATVALPLGISFFSFQQIAYIVDYHRGGRRDDNFIDYSLAVLFFPHLIAGPLVKYRALIDQFDPNAPKAEGAGEVARLFRPTAIMVAVGVTIFAIGLFKKVFFADSFAVYANQVFQMAEDGTAMAGRDAWMGATSFFFQIYFDFSGYTDMAIGLALFFGIRLPVNFLSPYMSRSIIEFWRRWHITLSSFLRDYVYVSLGGNRRGPAMRHFNLLLTMLIGGLWHGASWTFVAWGGLHGLFLVVNHFYNGIRERIPIPSLAPERWFYQALTVFAVLMTWVYFRADSFGGAHRLFAEMFDFSDFAGVTALTYERAASTLPGQFTRAFIELDMPSFGMVTLWLGFAGLAALLVFGFPNTYELFSRYHEAEADVPESLRTKPIVALRWSPSVIWMLFTALVLAIGLLSMTQVAQFIYFEF